MERSLSGLRTLGEALRAMQAQPMTTAPMAMFAGLADPLEAVLAAARAAVVGRERTFRAGGTEVTMTITDLDVQSTPTGLMLGQYENVMLAAERVSWRVVRLAQLTVRCHNVHLRNGMATTLVAAPIEIEATVDEQELRRWLPARLKWLELTIGADGVARVAVAGRARWGHLEVGARMDGSAVRLVPTAIVLGGGRRWPLRRLPGLRVQPTRLPKGSFLTAVATGPRRLTVTVIILQWQESISRTLLGKLAERLRSRRRRLDLTRDDDGEEVAPT